MSSKAKLQFLQFYKDIIFSVFSDKDLIYFPLDLLIYENVFIVKSYLFIHDTTLQISFYTKIVITTVDKILHQCFLFCLIYASAWRTEFSLFFTQRCEIKQQLPFYLLIFVDITICLRHWKYFNKINEIRTRRDISIKTTPYLPKIVSFHFFYLTGIYVREK